VQQKMEMQVRFNIKSDVHKIIDFRQLHKILQTGSQSTQFMLLKCQA